MKNVKEYYKLLGKLAFAVAMADGLIQKEESQKLKNKILTEFSHQEPGFDSSGMNKAFYVDFEFEASAKSLPEWNETIKHFVGFIEQNYEKADEKLLIRSVDLLKEIATSYSKEKEKAIIQTLQNKLKNTLYPPKKISTIKHKSNNSMTAKKKANNDLEIVAGNKMSVIQKEFNLVYPYLKLEYFKTPHGHKAASQKKDMLKQDFVLSTSQKKNSQGSIAVKEDMTVAALENQFELLFGISVQVFRKSGRSWLETSMTDDWTLKRQNDQGKELSYFA